VFVVGVGVGRQGGAPLEYCIVQCSAVQHPECCASRSLRGRRRLPTQVVCWAWTPTMSRSFLSSTGGLFRPASLSASTVRISHLALTNTRAILLVVPAVRRRKNIIRLLAEAVACAFHHLVVVWVQGSVPLHLEWIEGLQRRRRDSTSGTVHACIATDAPRLCPRSCLSIFLLG
jgi:hypothetical protein